MPIQPFPTLAHSANDPFNTYLAVMLGICIVLFIAIVIYAIYESIREDKAN